MATYYVWNGGSDGDGLSWTNAKTTLAGAIALATASGDVIFIEKTHTGDNALAADTTFTFMNNVSLICVDKTASDALAEMGTSAWIGHSSQPRSIRLTGGYRVFIYGITLRVATGSKNIVVSDASGTQYSYAKVLFWQGATSGALIDLGSGGGAGNPIYSELKNCTFRFGHTVQSIRVNGSVFMFECAVSSLGSVPTTLFTQSTSSRTPRMLAADCDFSYLGSGTLVGNMVSGSTGLVFYRCKLGSSMTPLATQNPANKSTGIVYLLDCSSGDTHGLFGYYDALGSCVSDTGIYFTNGAAQQSWKITTSSNVNQAMPFVTPPIPVFHNGTAAITPYLEILRDGSATAYKDDEVWAEFALKTTSNTVLGTASSDAATLLSAGANQDSGAGLSSWTGESGTAWSGKCGLSGSVTPAETGEIVARVFVAAASATVYVDPQIRW